MIGYWITPDNELIKIDDSVIEHIQYAAEQGWLDEFLQDDPEPEEDEDIGWDEDDLWYEWVERMKDNLFKKGYSRSRYYAGPDTEGDISIQGLPEKITPELIEKVLIAHQKGLDYPITIETGDGRELLSKGTLNDWLFQYGKKYNRDSAVAFARNNPMFKETSDALCKDIYFPSHLIDAVRKM